MRRYFRLSIAHFCLLLALFSGPAQASYWIECQVTARIAKPDHGNIYVIHIQSAYVTGGQAGVRQEAQPCMQDNIGKTLRVPIDNMPAQIRQQQIIRLRYKFSHHKTRDGGQKKESWSYMTQVIHPLPPPVMPLPGAPPYDPPYGDMRMCPEDAKLCPDGSAVGRTGPHCSFAPCP